LTPDTLACPMIPTAEAHGDKINSVGIRTTRQTNPPSTDCDKGHFAKFPQGFRWNTYLECPRSIGHS
jgi:hypothetical protein